MSLLYLFFYQLKLQHLLVIKFLLIVKNKNIRLIKQVFNFIKIFIRLMNYEIFNILIFVLNINVKKQNYQQHFYTCTIYVYNNEIFI